VPAVENSDLPLGRPRNELVWFYIVDLAGSVWPLFPMKYLVKEPSQGCRQECLFPYEFSLINFVVTQLLGMLSRRSVATCSSFQQSLAGRGRIAFLAHGQEPLKLWSFASQCS